MATFKTLVRNGNTDGLSTVYIRVTHNRQVQYVKTDKRVSKQGFNSVGEVTDPVVLQFCLERILEYQSRLNHFDTTSWTSKQVVEYLKFHFEMQLQYQQPA